MCVCVRTCAFDPVPDPARSAAASEAAGGVRTARVSVAVMSADLTLVNI